METFFDENAWTLKPLKIRKKIFEFFFNFCSEFVRISCKKTSGRLEEGIFILMLLHWTRCELRKRWWSWLLQRKLPTYSLVFPWFFAKKIFCSTSISRISSPKKTLKLIIIRQNFFSEKGNRNFFSGFAEFSSVLSWPLTFSSVKVGWKMSHYYAQLFFQEWRKSYSLCKNSSNFSCKCCYFRVGIFSKIVENFNTLLGAKILL